MTASRNNEAHPQHLNLRNPVYVWQFPIRFFHWINAAAIVILFVTGMYIGNPAFSPSGEATQNFIMGTVRYWHGITAYIFTANLLFRLYWFWAGNKYSKIFFWRKEFWQDLIITIKYYLFFSRDHRPHLGHNPLAQLSYLLFIWIGSAIMIITGFAMRSGMDQSGIVGSLYSWVIPTFHNESSVRMLHHILAWGYVVFLLVHLYLVFRQDIIDKDGTVSSIVNGYKFQTTSDHHSESELSAEELIPESGK